MRPGCRGRLVLAVIFSVSTPAPPFRMSLPLPPSMTLFAALPVIVSFRSEPVTFSTLFRVPVAVPAV
jgi:hypothetical protein